MTGGKNMLKIKDRFTLGVLSGIIGNAAKTVVDEISLKQNISQRSFRSAAAGIYVSRKSEAVNIKGSFLGGLYDFGLGAIGGIGLTYMLTKTGMDNLLLKGTVSGISYGAIISGLISIQSNNKVSPKDAASNLSYLATHAVYGMVTASMIKWLGDPSLFEPNPDRQRPLYQRRHTYKMRVPYKYKPEYVSGNGDNLTKHP
jgi:hypothetical protein